MTIIVSKHFQHSLNDVANSRKVVRFSEKDQKGNMFAKRDLAE